MYKRQGNAELTRVVNDLLQTMMRLWYYLELWDKDFLSDADCAPNILKALENAMPIWRRRLCACTSIIPSLVQ